MQVRGDENDQLQLAELKALDESAFKYGIS